MASFHTVETVMNVIITREGDPMYKNEPMIDIDYVDHWRFIRADHVDQWSHMLKADKWFCLNLLPVIDDAEESCVQNGLINERLSSGDKAAMLDRIGYCLSYRMGKIRKVTVNFRIRDNGALEFQLSRYPGKKENQI